MAERSVKLPSTVRVGPLTYSVSNSAEDHGASVEQHGQCSGLSDHDKSYITMDPDLSASVQRATMLHEVLHCVWRLLGPDTPKKIDEEYIVSRLEMGLLDTLQRNPDLLTYLLTEEAA